VADCGITKGHPKMARLADLWAGRLPLSAAFWNYAIFWGFLINLTATLSSLALLVAAGGNSPDTLTALTAAGLHFAPVPYNLLVLVGVWRSAGRPEVKPGSALIARLAVLGWTAALLIV
jgi:hypothetical protein